MSRLLTALLVVTIACPVALLGQAPSPTASITPGARVRITQTGKPARVAVVVTPGADTLLVRWPEYSNTVAVPLAEVSRLELSTGRHRQVAKRALVGTLTAGTVGAVFGAATYSPCKPEGFNCLLAPTSRGQSAAVGGVLGGVLGLVVGTLAGLPRTESWRELSLSQRRVAVAVSPRGRGSDLGVSLRF